MKRNSVITALFIICVLILSGCGHKNYMKIDVSTAAIDGESMSSATGAQNPGNTESPDGKALALENETSRADSAARISTVIHTYEEGKVSIEYPSITGLEDGEKEKKINALLKSNALEIQKACSVNPKSDSLSITAKIISADRKRITATYTGLLSGEGAAHPVHLFFTNTVDISQAKDISLTDYADPRGLAEYIRSSDCQFNDTSPELTEALLPYLAETSQEAYVKMFQNADFPLKAEGPDNTSVFPESFSYEDHGTIIVSVPVPHSLGDFALIKYTPETK
ncbi:hypothetical protein [Lacrimispora saccharolytica]|uniref:DUF4163 domain-containing protein n=1 Tax=Lacrimispora saccharolytica (strain ATCC 35040 / DSM 2544 / NRCC 2533 / WM1) TaxID=610130 RepID=D9R010_LACSW|nr:hypothetical protein [Lacrimispora saccharolytica]ADL04461.1 hypothetical protein Closa_1881 [[Clostridium] saccharolyticum WM1]QRV21279.1 DUF4163 domain-containing protein [Lacrimispora saccharolytica]